MTIGERIKTLRKGNNLTQKQLGELCGMADSAIRKYESGKISPKRQTLQKIANALEVSEWELLGEVRTNPTLGEQLKALRIKNKITQNQLAEKLHTTKATIRSYEEDQCRPSREQLAEIANALGANPDDFYNLLFSSAEPLPEEYDNWAEYWQFLHDYIQREWPNLLKLSEESELDEWITDLNSPFFNYKNGSEQLEIVKSLIKILSNLDLEWQRKLLNDAQTYINLQNKSMENTRMLEQEE